MRRASFSLSPLLVLLAGLLTGQAALAGSLGGAGDGGKRPGNSFNLIVAPPPAATPVQLTAPGVGIAPGRVVIVDPYKVPLIQDAGSLSPGR